MKKYTEKDLQKTADKYYFKNGIKEIFAVDDGSFFDLKNEGGCYIHAKDRKVFLLKKSVIKDNKEAKKEPKKEDKKQKNNK